MRMGIVTARLTRESHVQQAEHVEASDQGSDKPDKPQEFAGRAVLESLVENGVFREESREREESADGENGRGHGPERNRDFFTEATDLAQVLLAPKSVDDRAGGQEEQS